MVDRMFDSNQGETYQFKDDDDDEVAQDLDNDEEVDNMTMQFGDIGNEGGDNEYEEGSTKTVG